VPAISAMAKGAKISSFATPARGVYRRLVIKDNVVIGAVMYGDTADKATGSLALSATRPIFRIWPRSLIFGPAYQGGTPWTL